MSRSGAAADHAWATPDDRQEAARQAYRRSLAGGSPLTGVALGEMFGRSPRWGSDRTAEVRAQLADPSATGSSHPSSTSIRSRPAAPDATELRAVTTNGNGTGAKRGTASTRSTSSPVSGSARPGNGTRPAANRQPARPTPGAAAPRATSAAAEATTGNRWERHAVTAGKAAVRLVAAAVSYEHMRAVAEAAGETGWRAVVLPVSVDGLAVLALVTMRTQRRHGVRPSPWAWVALVLAIVASLAANVAAADPTPAGRLVAAWPPVALFLAEVLDRPHGDVPGQRTAGATS